MGISRESSGCFLVVVRKRKHEVTKRRKAYNQGKWSELFAMVYLRIKGYRILSWRYRTPVGEIDLIVKKGNTIVAVEVKHRPTYTQGVEAVKFKQRKRIIRAMECYLQRHKKFENLASRFDVVILQPLRWPQHLKNAWDSMVEF